MFRCVRLWTGSNHQSCFEEGWIDLPKGERHDLLSDVIETTSISFRETSEGGSFSWHDAPNRQFVLTLSGTLTFETRTGDSFTLYPGDILLAEDTTGSGHRWHLIDNQPWRRVYAIVPQDIDLPFISASSKC
ncbi:hypothetical protein [Halomonas sp. AOP43-D1-4]|uniref:hypothetical protein n=1 Tax=Halomonas sp. AOP43-D1-4 TaxID=3457658 RepID=UPI004033F2B7